MFLGKDGAQSAQYTGTINRVGIDIGCTRAVGEQGTVAAGSQAGGNWIYGRPNAEVGMLASGVVQDAGYNLATGIAEMTIRLKR